ncbi:hypothetical protein UA08_04718 [Talaromyces atroroseus]|uniref:Zn(2)-C6 fungal-type domain-containing protein n=1 Tax=Talaromyces atroroseus TaxID=1441469 RepID=A0A225AGK3_TALAT|nr:hypothetical protein UA08_04718 [Talaromyces atroroseus]OKL59820.1 hypothetical protein UA08_04718 [Talaromyces atroroseus]
MSSFPSRNQHLPTLSCEFCRQRKIKCDKLNPCTNCQKAGINCESVRRKRLPRGRHANNKPGGTTQDLRDKIARLEALVNVAIAESSSGTSIVGSGKGDASTASAFTENGWTLTSADSQKPTAPSPAVSGSTTDSRPVAPQFWSNVMTEIHGVQGMVSEDTDDEDDRVEEHEKPFRTPTSSSYLMGLSLGRLGRLHSLSLRPSRAVTDALCDIFLNHVDRIIKVLHRPSLKQHLLDGTPYPTCKDSPNAENALDTAVFYAAVASMTDRQCQQLFQCARMDVLPEYQSACETALERADLMRTTDITVLQAFVLYLVATRAHDKSRAVWTLLATAVRIAQALNLHVESLHPTETFFDRQMRKRLWLTICVLDVQTSIDPDSLPLIPLEMTQIALPRNVNDTDFDISYKGHDLPERQEVTDMTFPLVIYSLQAFGRRLYYTEPQQWSAHEELVASFHNITSQLTKYCNPDDSNYSWFVHYGTQSLEAAARLHIFRRFASMRDNMPSFNQERPSILALCAKVIENAPRIQNDERGEGFRWYVTPQWPTVVVAIRECYISTDPTLVMQVWPLIEDVFEHYKKAHADPNGRAKTRMIRKLMERTRERVNALIQSTSVDSQNIVPTLDFGSLPQEPGEPLDDTTMANIEKQSFDPMDPSWAVGWDDLINELSYGAFPSGEFGDWKLADNLFG